MRLRSATKARHLWRVTTKDSPRQQFEQLAREIAVLNSSYATRTFWRGVSSADFLLWPSAYRQSDWPKEQGKVDLLVDRHVSRLEEQFVKARVHWPVSYAARYADDRREKLAVMQHQGVPTKLVDMTADPYIALWFACEDHKRDGHKSRDGGALLAFNFPLDDAEAKHDELNADSGFKWFRPPAIDSRIVAQRSIFLRSKVIADSGVWPSDIGRVHVPDRPSGWTASSMVSLFGSRTQGRPAAIPAILAFEVRAGSKSAFRRILDRNHGLTRDSLFPDLGGLE